MRPILTIFCFTALALFAFAEILLAMPLAGWLYLVLPPFFAVALLRWRPESRRTFRLATFMMVMAALAALHFVPWTGRKTFLRDLYTIRPGMTEDQVRRIMARYIEGTGWPAPGGSAAGESLLLPGSLVFRHSNEAAFNSDWGIVALKDGKVSDVRFSAD